MYCSRESASYFINQNTAQFIYMKVVTIYFVFALYVFPIPLSLSLCMSLSLSLSLSLYIYIYIYNEQVEFDLFYMFFLTIH